MSNTEIKLQDILEIVLEKNEKKRSTYQRHECSSPKERCELRIQHQTIIEFEIPGKYFKSGRKIWHRNPNALWNSERFISNLKENFVRNK